MPDSCVSLKGKILSGDREFSQAQLLENVARAATGLSAIGIGTAATVAIMLGNDFPFFEASMAANAVGGYAVPINWRSQAAEAALHTPRQRGARARRARGALPTYARAS